MNWIDKKYREQLKEGKYVRSTRQRGWEKVQPMLDREFPLPAGATSKGTAFWRYGLFGLAALSLLVAGIVWMGPADSSENEVGYYLPRESAHSLEKNAVGDAGGQVNSAENEPDLEGKVKGSRSADMTVNGQGEGERINSTDPSNDKSAGELEGNLIADGSPADEKIKNDESGDKPVGQGRHDLEDKLKSTPEDPSIESPKNRTLGSFNDKTSTSGDQGSLKTEDQDGGELSNTESPMQKHNSPAGKQPQEEKAPENQNTNTLAGTEHNAGGEKSIPQVPGTKDEATGGAEDSSQDTAQASVDPADIAAKKITSQEVDLQRAPAAATEEESANQKSKLAEAHLSFSALTGASSSSEDFIPTLSGRRFSVALWGGYTYTGKLLQADNPGYRDKRKAEEEAIWTTPTGIDFDYYLDRRWTFSTGLSWSEYGEQINYDVTRTDSAFIDGRYDSPKSYTGIIAIDSVRIIDSINQGHWNYRLVYQYNDSTLAANNGRTHITYVEIPLLVGYRMGSGWARPWVKTGVSLGIPIRSDFQYINPSASDIQLQASKPTIAPLQWSYLLNLGVDCRLSRHWSLRFSGMSSVHLNSVLQDQPVKQRYYRLGGRVGVAYHF
ncbi:MAG: outer membrane beta-barrel protein [Owenweeksia sp.]|nr:outer membrane beta-barrel protein [Owenweeksia sp.]